MARTAGEKCAPIDFRIPYEYNVPDAPLTEDQREAKMKNSKAAWAMIITGSRTMNGGKKRRLPQKVRQAMAKSKAQRVREAQKAIKADDGNKRR